MEEGDKGSLFTQTQHRYLCVKLKLQNNFSVLCNHQLCLDQLCSRPSFSILHTHMNNHPPIRHTPPLSSLSFLLPFLLSLSSLSLSPPSLLSPCSTLILSDIMTVMTERYVLA